MLRRTTLAGASFLLGPVTLWGTTVEQWKILSPEQQQK